MKNAITLVVPGLFAAEPIGDASLRAPALEFLLSRADTRVPELVSADYYTHLLRLFGIRTQPDEEPPVAAISHLIDFGSGHEGIWIRADPVSLRPDLHRLVLYDAFPLEKAQALALAQEVNTVLADRGWHIDIGRDVRRWYVHLEELPQLRTHPPSAVRGWHIDSFLPRGPEAVPWHGLINAIQMALHDCPVNRARERSGLPPVNSIWFWGAGALPSPPSSPWNLLVSDDSFALGLAKLGQCRAHPNAEADAQDALSAEGDVLVVLGGERHDAGAWATVVEALDKQWVEPLLHGFKEGCLNAITLNTGDKIFRLTEGGMRRFWRRKRPLGAYLRATTTRENI